MHQATLRAVSKLSHVSATGSLSMVDISAKPETLREAHAQACLRLPPHVETALRKATVTKGDALVAAQLAGILAAKRTATLIPLTHSVPLSRVDVTFHWPEPGMLRIETVAQTTARTGVEMEAMVAASVAALTVYDMTKSLEKGIVIQEVRLVRKSGGKSGNWSAPE